MNKPLEARLLQDADGETRWQHEYAAQIGQDKLARNRSGIADQAALHAARLGRRAL